MILVFIIVDMLGMMIKERYDMAAIGIDKSTLLSILSFGAILIFALVGFMIQYSVSNEHFYVWFTPSFPESMTKTYENDGSADFLYVISGTISLILMIPYIRDKKFQRFYIQLLRGEKRGGSSITTRIPRFSSKEQLQTKSPSTCTS